MSQRSQDAISRPFGPHASERPCDMPGCCEAGQFRAPKSRDKLTDYRWFCLEHVRQYNRAWDYLKGMSEAEIEAFQRDSTTWQRPTWPFAGAPHRTQEEILRRLRRDFASGFEAGGERTKEAGPEGRPAGPLSEAARALDTLDLRPSATFDEVKARYKVLAKTLHPDANGGDHEAEERLKVVNQAYAVLRKNYVDTRQATRG